MTPHPAPTDAADLPHAAPADALSAPVADAVAGNWVDRYAPAAARPYLRLARIDRPIGTWLLLFPCWWSLALAEVSRLAALPEPLVSRAVRRRRLRRCAAPGCAYNDYRRSRLRRPGRAHRQPADPVGPGRGRGRRWLFAAALALVGFVVLIQFNTFTIWLGISLARARRDLSVHEAHHLLAAARARAGLQLGRAGRLGGGQRLAVGRAAAALCRLVLWTIGYDTIYAHQDKEDDLMLGLKSTALRFGEATVDWVGGFYAGAVVLWALAGAAARRTPDLLYGAGADRRCSSRGRSPRSTSPTPGTASAVPLEPGRRRRAVPGTRGRHGFVALSRIGVNPSPDAIRRGSGFASPAPNATPHCRTSERPSVAAMFGSCHSGVQAGLSNIVNRR